AAVADRGDRAAFLFHVVPFARLGVAAVLAVAVLVHPARAAGHADRGPRAVARLGGHPRVRCLERVLVGLRGPVHPAAGRGTVGVRRLTRGMRLTRGVRGRLAGDGGGRLAGDLPGRLPGGLTGHLPGRLFAPVEAHPRRRRGGRGRRCSRGGSRRGGRRGRRCGGRGGGGRGCGRRGRGRNRGRHGGRRRRRRHGRTRGRDHRRTRGRRDGVGSGRRA